MDLSTEYLGLQLDSPLVPSPSPLTRSLEGLRRLEDAGAGAVVLPSLFEENARENLPDDEVVRDPHTASSRLSPEAYLDLVSRAKQALSIPVIASLNGITPDYAWLRYARDIQEAGADALELNLYFLASDPSVLGKFIENVLVRVCETVITQVVIPVSVKITPFFTSIPNLAERFARAGARGMVLFNPLYQPGLDPAKLGITSDIDVSQVHDLHLPLHWTSLLYRRVPLDLAVSGGIRDHEGAARALLAGGSVAMLTSELLAKGPHRLAEIRADLEAWMNEQGFGSIRDMQGLLSRSAQGTPDEERTNYRKIVQGNWPD